MITVATTQKPSADVVPTYLRDLFGFRWALRCSTPEASDTILGRGWASQGYSAAQIDPTARGVGLLLQEGGVLVRLRGRVERADASTGEVRTVYSTDQEPDATLLKGCGNGGRRSAPPARRPTRATSSTSSRPGCGAARACPSRWLAIQGCSSPSPHRPLARCTRAGRRGCWSTPVTPIGRAIGVRPVAGLDAGSATI
jgi:hypothetical protein